MGWFRRTRKSDATTDDLAFSAEEVRRAAIFRAEGVLASICEGIAVVRGVPLEDVTRALAPLDVEQFGWRLLRHEELAERASAGDRHAGTEFMERANEELIDLLRERGADASLFED